MRVLLAVDGSPSSRAAIKAFARRPWPPETEVEVVTADLAHDPGYFRGAPISVFDEISRQQRSSALKILADSVSELESVPGVKVTSKLLEGNAKDAILDEIDVWKPDLVMLGSHGHGAVKRLWLGSVSLAIATHAPCSVEIVRCAPSSEPAATQS